MSCNQARFLENIQTLMYIYIRSYLISDITYYPAVSLDLTRSMITTPSLFILASIDPYFQMLPLQFPINLPCAILSSIFLLISLLDLLILLVLCFSSFFELIGSWVTYIMDLLLFCMN